MINVEANAAHGRMLNIYYNSMNNKNGFVCVRFLLV